ncbi:MAG TPA: SH3 domain-containing protein [Gemmatimonadales bacterium]
MRPPSHTFWVALLISAAACNPRNESAPPVPPAPVVQTPPQPESVLVRDPALEQRLARLELAVLEKDAQVEDLRARLDEARREVVRAMAKLQTLASRAEAASAMAEAEIAIQAARGATAGTGSEGSQAEQLLALSAAEFQKQNFGGAVYLANQAKSAASGNGLAAGSAAPLRSGEVQFAVPVRLQASAPCNVRVGPGTIFRVAFTAERGTRFVGLSHSGEWVRVRDEGGRGGWVHQALVGRRTDAP